MWTSWPLFSRLPRQTPAYETPSWTSTDLFFLWSAGAYFSRLPCSFRLLKDGPNSSGSSDHPVVSTNTIDISHPLVDCFIDGVRVRALLDTGSIKSFIGQNGQRVIDFDNSLLDKSCAQTCVSITGDKLHILAQLSTIVKFCQSKVTYLGDVFVSDNMQYECVLRWDFIHHHQSLNNIYNMSSNPIEWTDSK